MQHILYNLKYSGSHIKGRQLNSEWIYEVIVSTKMPAKNHKDFCPTKLTFSDV